ncbi:plectin isoform X25 [Antechinus flavipes]|uniref:plectin isoform X25 n=1 Tax=Antechinus flavipes TaxID=38775 RepID=UPI002235450E|nr:plectin isoform X25 [Antechinus flavipes]
MVAGMLMPLDQLRAIYELLFREGVMVAKKDLRPQSLHPHVPGGVTNLQVIRAMGSLRARGLVRETFAWRHFYWYLTNEGIAHLRQYLHLPPEIVPASLQRVRRPVAMVAPARRPPTRVQTVQGPLSCPPKRPDSAREERQAYRRKEDEEVPEPPVVPTFQGPQTRTGPEPTPAPDERDRVQKKTFTKWVNKHLIKHWRAEAQRHISDLYEDLRDGHNLISLLEVLSGDSLPRERDVIRNLRLPREKGRMRFHKLQNVQIALDYLRHRQVKLVNIRNDDIADGNPKLTLGLIWTIILHFQISDIQVSGQSEDMTAKEKLLLWSQRMVEGYQNLRCDNFTASWRDGRLFNAIIHRHKPMLIDMNKVYQQSNLENLDQAFNVAERELGVTRLLDPEDVDVPQPDEKSIITYVSSLYDAMPRVPDVQDGVKANELQLRWQEYRELVMLLLQWIRQHIIAFEERKFATSYEETEILWCQFLKFKETELPAKEADKNRSKNIYQSLEGAVQAGQLKVPPGFHPLDVEKEWGKLHVAILEREKQLRTEFERQECLQRIVSKLQMESSLCEEQLNQADALLQLDIRLLTSGKAPQHAGEVERDLDKADGMIRLLFNDVQTLKDGRHPQGEQMYRRVYRLHERLVAIRTEYNLRLKAGVPVTQVSPVGSQRRPELEDVTLRYLQDLLAWVEENQRRLDGAEWGVDLPSVESQLGSHRGLHQSIEEFRAKIERARADESQLSPATRGAYRDCLGKLDLQYAKLLNTSKARLRGLENLHGFVAAATKELMWLNEKEEEEVNYDWSERNSNMAAKKDSYSALMRELEQREKKVKEIQNTAERLLREDHPGKSTVEAFQAALQTQWSWMLQLCCCLEAHLKENTAYFQFFSDVREAEEQLQKLQEMMRRKYICDRSITVTRLEDLLQDAQDEKEQISEYKGHLLGLAKRAKAIVQLKPRNPAYPIRGRLPLQAVCDYKQMEMTVHKGDTCQLVGHAQPSKWKVVHSSGSEAVLPSVCFLVPPPNKEAQEAVSRLEGLHQTLESLWHQLHVDMKSLLAWQCLTREIQLIRSWSLVTFRTLKPEEQRQALCNLELHYQAFLRDSQDSGSFGPEDRLQVERDYSTCTRHYQQLLQNLEQGEQEESLCQRYISELKDIRLQLEACEGRIVHRLRVPLEKEPARECAQRITEQQKVQAEVEGLGQGVSKLSAKAEKVLAQPEPAPGAPALRSELDLTLGKLDQVRSLSAIYLEKLKTISLVIRSTQGAEEVLRTYEEQLKDVQNVPADLSELEATKAELKKLRSQVEAQQPLFAGLNEELRAAQEVGERMQQKHGERDAELERWRERVTQLLERWQAVLAQIDLRQRELDQLGRQLRYYRESAEPLNTWLLSARQRQEQIQSVPLADSQVVREQLQQEKKLLEEIERHGEKVAECQKYAKQYINAIKDYELQLVTYKAQVEPVASPAKKPKVQSVSDSVIQEYVDLRTRYSELTTLTSQYIKFISETLRRLEEEEMQMAQKEQLLHETQVLQQTFLTEKDSLLQRERFIEEEKAKLEKLFQEEVGKAQSLRAEQERQQKQMEQEKQRLLSSMDEAKRRQKEAEDSVRRKQEELQQLEQRRQQQEKLLAEENQKLREKLERLEEEHRAALAQTRAVMIQTEERVAPTKALPNGRDAVDGLAQNGEPEFAFEGLRQKVPAKRLEEAGVLSREQLDKLAEGAVSVGELSQREDVRRYLQGGSSIAGLLLKPTNEKVSIYKAMKKQLLSPGTALILLEAQAASGFIIDPVRNKRLSVNEAVKESVVGPELHNKLLSAERAVTGYKDPYTGDKISLFQAMQKDLIVKDHGVRLLEAQIATGGVIDPVHSHRVPVEVAYQRGYLDEEMSKILSDPSDDTKGFFDPNTHENLTYLQLLERCVTDPDTGLRLLPLTDAAAKGGELVYTDNEARDVFEKATVSAPFGRFRGKTVTIWEIINSEYFTEEQRRDLLRQYRTGKITVEKIIKIVITVVEEHEKKSQLCFEGLRAPVPAAELMESRVIDQELFHQLSQGKRTVQEVAEVESVRKYLRGANAIAGVWVEESGQKLSAYEALKKNLLKPEVALSLLEAQAGTGHIIDPLKNARLSVDEAVKSGLVGPELHEKLLSAEKAVTGYKDPYTGQVVSLFQALKKGLIPSDHGLRLLDAQLSTGGIIDPGKSHRVPLEVAYERGYLDEEMNKALSTPKDSAKAFYDPNTQENLTYSQLQKKCRKDKKSGLLLLPLSEKAIRAQQEEIYTDLQAKESFEKATVEVPVGSFKGRTVTIWELIHSEYFTEEQRRELVRQYKTGKVTIEKIIKIMITIIEETETKRQEKLTFSGLRTPVAASELLESRVISRAQFDQLKDGKKSVKDISETDSVKRFLQGTDCIAGIYVEETKEKLTIYQAMRRNLLRPSTAVVLLEAQAATGFVIDPIKNQRLYVNEAVKAGVVGPELHEKLLSAEKAVTGYKDPYSGNTISLFEAMKKGLILREHGVRLLEAQVATGGIIDPVHSHRVPVEVAYKRGYLDEEMNRTLSDPSDDTKGFFDPNTQENLTYLQLKQRCVEDPETGLYLLSLKKPEKPEVVETTQVYTEEETRRAFEETQIDIPGGSQGSTSMSLWEVMQSDMIPEEQRARLMEDFRAGKVTKERMIIIIIEIIEKTEIIRQQNLHSYDYVRRRITAEDLYEARIISLETYNLVREGTKTIREVLEAETAWRYLYGSGCVAGIYLPASKQKLTIYQALKKGLISAEVARTLLEAQAATGFMIDPVKNERLTVDEAVRKGLVGPEIHDRLLSAERAVTGYRDPYTEQTISLFQAMKKDLISSEEALRLLDAQLATGGIIDPRLGFHLPLEIAYQRGYLNKDTHDQLSEPSEVRSYVDPSTEEKLSYTQLLKRCRRDENSGQLLLPLSDTRKLTFRGLRKQITVEELVRSRVMDEATALQLQEGLTSIEEVSKNLKKYLEGTSCIAGVFVDSTKERLSVYQAMKKGIIRPGTAFELLEAQAATGFVIDPIKNQRLYVNEAVKAGVVGPELHEKLLSAEKAVTGYKDPYSGNTISLFEAMKKGLILREHGVRLLEAQVATGGIIDPVHSHRVPVEVAYKRGYLDEEMNRTLSDPSDDTKGFFDPNTQENLTYLQLKQRCVEDPETGLYLLSLKKPEKPEVVETTQVYTEEETRRAFEETQIDIPGGSQGSTSMSLWEVMQSDMIPEEQRARLMEDFRAGKVTKERMIIIIIEIIEKTEIIRQQNLHSYDYVRRRITAEDLYEARIISLETYNLVREGTKTIREVLEAETAWRYLYGSGCVAGIYLPASKQKLTIYQALKKGLISTEVARTLLEAQAATGFMIDPVKNERLTVDEAVRKGLVGPEIHDRLLSAERAVTGYRDPYTEQTISLFQAMKKDLISSEEALRLLDAQLATGGIIDPRLGFHLPLEIAYQRGYLNKDTHDQLSEPSEVRSYVDPSTEEKLSYTQLLKRCRRDENSGQLLLPLSDTRKLTFRGLRKQITVEELVRSRVMDEATALQLQEGLTSIEEVSKNLKKYLEGTSCIAGVFVDSTKERLSVYQAMKKGIIRPGTAFELLEAQAATGYVIDPIKGLKLTVEEAVRMGIVGPEFKDKLISAERAVIGYKDPYSGKLISLFQAMKKGLILKDHGIRLLEAQIATGGIIDPEESHRLPVEMAYKRGLFDEEMNEILTDPSDDTKGFFDPNTEENLTYLQLMERCITDPETGLCLLPLKEKKRERKTSSKSSVRKRRVVIVDPETGKEMSVYEAYRKGLIDHQTYLELSEQECEWEEITISSSDGVVKSMIIDRRSGRQYDIDDAISKSLIDQSALDQYRAGTLSITEFADMLSGNMSGFRSRSSSVGSSSSYPISPAVSRTQLASWSDPTEETGPVAGILDTDTLEKVSITEAMHRNLVDNITGQRLLEAQACTGGIIDPHTGEKFPVTDAVNKGLVDKIMVDRINLAQKAFYGFEDPRTKTKMSAAQALKKGWLYYEAGQRFLEVQYLTGGLIEPDTPARVSLDEALQKGTIDARTAQKLRDVNTYSKYLTCPKTKLKISYKDAMDRSMTEEGTGLRLLEASSQSSKGYYSPYSVSGSGSTSGSRAGSRTGSRAGSRRGSFDATGSGFSMTFSSSSYSSSGYGRRYALGPHEASEAAQLSSNWGSLSGSCGGEAGEEWAVLGGPQPAVA